MGGNPKRKVDLIKRFVTENDPKQEKKLGEQWNILIIIIF